MRGLSLIEGPVGKEKVLGDASDAGRWFWMEARTRWKSGWAAVIASMRRQAGDCVLTATPELNDLRSVRVKKL